MPIAGTFHSGFIQGGHKWRMKGINRLPQCWCSSPDHLAACSWLSPKPIQYGASGRGPSYNLGVAEAI